MLRKPALCFQNIYMDFTRFWWKLHAEQVR